MEDVLKQSRTNYKMLILGGLLTQFIVTGCTNKEKSAQQPRYPAAESEMTIPDIMRVNQQAGKPSYAIPIVGFKDTSKAALQKMLAKYCSIGANGRIQMNINRMKMEYADPGMEAAADKLDQIYQEQVDLLDYQRTHGIIQKDNKGQEPAPSIIAYSAIMRMHSGSNSMTLDEMEKDGLSRVANGERKDGHDYRTHQFMKTLCGEYIDRPTMIEAKIRWINTMHVLTDAQPVQFNPRANPWKNLNGQNYTKFLAMTDQVWNLKQEILEKYNKLRIVEAPSQSETEEVAQHKARLQQIEEQLAPLYEQTNQVNQKLWPAQEELYSLKDQLTKVTEAEAQSGAIEYKLSQQIKEKEQNVAVLSAQLQQLYAQSYPLEEEQSKINALIETPFQDAFELATPGQSVCETKYMIGSLVFGDRAPFNEFNKTFRADGVVNFKEYIDGYRKFRKGKTLDNVANCTRDDHDYIYDFRGDANFKPQTPESNGMIWHAQSITKQCFNYAQAKKSKENPNEKVMPDAVCKTYFEKPFASRYLAARSALATWLFRKGDGFNPQTFEDDLSDEKGAMWILPDIKSLTDPKLLGLSAVPTYYHNAESGKSFNEMAESNRFLPVNMARGDLGFNAIFNMNNKKRTIAEAKPAWHRLRDAVNRHTDWYASGYNDGFSDGMKRNQAYSPFVASSYEMSKSDAFVAAGYTVPGVGDFRRHWMYVFKVKRTNWYRQLDVMHGKPVNFDRHWLDETTLGTNHLAKHERAFDRLGSPSENEFDTIIYMHNLVYRSAPKMVQAETETVEIVDGKEQIKKTTVWKIDETSRYSDGEIVGNFILKPNDPLIDQNQNPL